MPIFHDPGLPQLIRERVESLRPDSPRVWGKMTSDQMLWHINMVLAESLGEYKGVRSVKGVPQGLFRWLVLNLPWGKGAPTRPDMKVEGSTHFDFEHEKGRCLAMIDRFTKQSLDDTWPPSANFGKMSGRHWSQLQYKHLDHHLRQFGA